MKMSDHAKSLNNDELLDKINGHDPYDVEFARRFRELEAENKALREGRGVTVKPLVWHERPEGQAQRIGRCDQIAYSVRFDMGSWGYTRQGESGLTVGRPVGVSFNDEADAMQGAQEDHERRIRAALSPAPVSVATAKCYGWATASIPGEPYSPSVTYSGTASAPEAEPMHEDAPAAIIGEIGNQIHNLGCEHQNDEVLRERLAELASRTWRAARLVSTEAPAPVSVEAAFERVWAVVKDWDISTEPGSHRLYEGINGDHVREIVAAALDISPAPAPVSVGEVNKEGIIDALEVIISDTHDIDVKDRHYAENVVEWIERHHPAALRAIAERED